MQASVQRGDDNPGDIGDLSRLGESSITKRIDIKFEDDSTYSLKQLFKNNLLLIKDEIREISEIASKEKGFEKVLYRMK